jgi:hypothetical protein
MQAFHRLPRLIPVAAALAILGGCATVAPPSAPGDAPPGAKSVAAAASAAASAPGGDAAAKGARPDPTAPKPFAEVIKDAQRSDGFIPVWRKDDKVWLEIAPERLGQPMLITFNVANSVGERGLYANQMMGEQQAEMRIVGRVLQVLAKNTAFRATGDAPMARTVQQSFSDSLIAATGVASAPHPENKAVLVDASFLLADLPGLSTRLEAAFRLPYGLDTKNSFIESTRGTAGNTAVTTQLHFATPRIPAPPLTPRPPNVPNVPPPQSVPDARSFFIGLVVNFMALPAQPMAPRLADARIGHFTDSYTELGNDLKPNPRVHYVKRWRLEKKDPAAALSAPVKPITFWLDRNIPERYRGAVTAGILEWNKAFEAIGFKDAVVAKQQPDDADFDTGYAEFASIRWFTGADVGFARGPSHTDARTGEILDADIMMSDVFARGSRRFITDDVGFSSFAQRQDLAQMWGGSGAEDYAYCTYAFEGAQEMAFAMDMLEARGELDPDSPEAEAFVQAQIKDTIMHEVGHVLGLKHNFRSSTVVTREQLQDKAFTDANAISGSVMDYNAYNISLEGEPKANLNVTTLGPYDYWAIEYAYKPIAPADEAAELARIAARSTEPLLAFADDADAGWRGQENLDPRDNRGDLGDDPLAWAEKRMTLSRELWSRLESRGPQAGDDPQRLRRSLLSGFGQLSIVPDVAGGYVGGTYTERDLPGTGRPSFRPVEPERQRQALQFLTTNLLSVDSFRFQPKLLTNVGVNYIEWRRAEPVSVPDAVLRLQTRVLNRLLDAGTASRLLDLPYYLPEAERKGAISLHEVYSTVQGAVWRELKAGGEIDPLRRNLQREHLKRLQVLLTKGAPGLPADALSLARLHATELQASLKQAANRRGLSVETRAHLQDSLGTLTEALRATMQRAG